MKNDQSEHVDVHYSLWGHKFLPSRLRVSGKVEIIEANDPGEWSKIAKRQGKPTDYGACQVRCTLIGRKKIVYLATHLKQHLASYRKQHATYVVFWILWRGLQGNMELSAQELKKLAAMKIAVAMDYIYVKD